MVRNSNIVLQTVCRLASNELLLLSSLYRINISVYKTTSSSNGIERLVWSCFSLSVQLFLQSLYAAYLLVFTLLAVLPVAPSGEYP